MINITMRTAKSKKGSTLIWALILMMVLGILITGGLMIAQAYTSQSLDSHVKTQSYYTAMSATRSVAEWLDGTSEDEPETKKEQLAFIKSLKESDEKSTTFDSTVNNILGTAKTTVSIEQNSENITVSTKATYNDISSTVLCVLKNMDGVIGSEGDPSQVKLIVPPKDEELKNLADSDEMSTAEPGEEDGQFFARRNIELDLRLGKSFRLANKMAEGSHSLWKCQYYALSLKGADTSKDVYLKLTNGNFPFNKSDGTVQDRYMSVYSADTTFGNNLNNFTIYTDDSVNQSDDPPRRHVIILPHLTEKLLTESWSTNKYWAFKNQEDTDYINTHIQINDTGETEGVEGKSILLLPGGTHYKNSTIYTRRDTFINMGYHSYNGFFWPDLNYSWTGEREYTGAARNTNAFNYQGTSFSLDGKLIVADNETTLLGAGKIKGDIIVKNTTTSQGKFSITGGSGTGVVLSDGSLYVKEGGYVNLSAWNTTCFNDIFVEPGGTVRLNGPRLYCNIYALKGRGAKTNEPAKVIVATQTRFYEKMTTMEDEEVVGGIYLEATNENDGAYLEQEGTGYVGSGTYDGIAYKGAIHKMPGAHVQSSFNLSSYCDARVNGTKTNIKDYCSCGIAVPHYGNTVKGWQIHGYSEE